MSARLVAGSALLALGVEAAAASGLDDEGPPIARVEVVGVVPFAGGGSEGSPLHGGRDVDALHGQNGLEDVAGVGGVVGVGDGEGDVVVPSSGHRDVQPSGGGGG